MEFTPRIVRDHILTSKNLPAARFQIDPQFTYVGNTTFILDDVTHIEQHHFVTANAAMRVDRLLWFQFEGFLDDKRRFNYTNMETMTLENFTFLHDADVMNIDDDYAERPTSDSAHVVDFLKQKGYTIEGEVMFKRMVWLDTDMRNELMIIYSEDLNSIGLSISDLKKDENLTETWSRISADLHKRAVSSFSIVSE